MAEGTSVGAIYYEVEADTTKLVNSVAPLDKSLDGLNKTFGQTDRAANQAQFRMTKTAAAVKGLGQQSSKTTTIMRSMATVLSTAMLIKLARDIVVTADAWTDLQNRLRLVTDTQKELAQSTNDVFRIAQNTSQEIDSIAQVYQRFAQSADTLGLSLGEVADVTNIVAKAVAISGSSAQAAEAALVQFGQAMASAELRGEELRSVMEQTPGLARAIADGLGVGIGALRELAEAGELTAKRVIEALRASAGGVDEQFSTRVKTAAHSWIELKNSIARFLGEASNASALTSSLADSLDRVSSAIDNVDVDSLALEIEGIKSIVSLVMDGIDELMRGAAEGADESAQGMTTSFAQMALELARIVDGIAATFQGTAGSVGAVWAALADNIPTYFSNAWSKIKSGAASFVNDLADMVNVPLNAVGFDGFAKVEVDAAPIRAVVSLTEAAAHGWNEAAKGVGAYERTLRRVTDSAINASIAEWQAEYTGEVKKTTAAVEGTAASTGKLSAAQKEQAKAADENMRVITALQDQLHQAALSGQALVEVQALSKLNKFATPEDVEQVRALAGALWALQQAEADRALIKEADPIQAEIEGYETKLAAYQDMLARKAISDEEYYQYAGDLAREHEDAMLALQEERFRNESVWNDMLMTGIDSLGQSAAAALESIVLGTGNAADAAKAFAGTILREVVGSFVQMGIQHVKAIILGRVAQSAAGAAYAAATAAQVQATTALAAQNAFMATAAIPIVGPALAPGAAAAAAAAAGALGAPAVGLSAAAAARQYGGPVAPERMYRINETGKPEVLNLANGQQFLLPNNRGEVVSNRDATRGADKASTRAASITNHITFAPVINTTWPLPDKEVRRLVKQLNDAVEDGMIIT